MTDSPKKPAVRPPLKSLGAVFLFILVVGAIAFAALPQYGVYAAHKHGEAELARAQQNRQIRVQEAQARFESADFDARAEVRRAMGVAQANKIIADSLGGPEGYLRWRYIEMLQETGQNGGREVIYVPTEANLPILEAGHRAALSAPAPAEKK
jgi:regulator of protease activity HflC (stomatin/prohibitin superfamily)